MPTDTTEAGLEALIVRHLTGSDGLGEPREDGVQDPPDAVAQAKAEGIGWFVGRADDDDRGWAVDPVQLFAFLKDTQPEALKKLGLA